MDSYEDILSRMKEKYFELSGCEVPELSDIDLRMKLLAGEIYNNEVNLEFVKRQIFASTAAGEYLDYHASDRGIERKEALKAKGEVRFWVNNQAAESITIPKGTVVATNGTAPVRFLTDKEAVLKGGDYFVTVACTAQEGGISGNIGSGTIKTIVTNVAGIDSVSNIWPFSGGSDVESDEVLRQRVLDTYKAVSNGTNKAYYKRLALSVEGVYSANVVPKARGTGTVDVYIACRNSAAPISLVHKVTSLINSQRELNVDVEVYAADVYNYTAGVYVTLNEGYELAAVKENIRKALSDYVETLEVGEGIPENRFISVIANCEGVQDFSFNNLYSSYVDADAETFIVFKDVIVEEEVE